MVPIFGIALCTLIRIYLIFRAIILNITSKILLSKYNQPNRFKQNIYQKPIQIVTFINTSKFKLFLNN